MAGTTKWELDDEAGDRRTPDELLAAYADGPRLVRAATSGMDASMLRARPIEGKMSTLEVVCHIADAEQFLADRMKRTAATEKPLLIGVNGMLYLEALRYQERDLDLQLRLIEATREQMSADLSRLDDSAWSREAIHSEAGLVTLQQLLIHAVHHLEAHVTALHEKRSALGI